MFIKITAAIKCCFSIIPYIVCTFFLRVNTAFVCSKRIRILKGDMNGSRIQQYLTLGFLNDNMDPP